MAVMKSQNWRNFIGNELNERGLEVNTATVEVSSLGFPGFCEVVDSRENPHFVGKCGRNPWIPLIGGEVGEDFPLIPGGIVPSQWAPTMGQQSKKIIKRRRRADYLKRKKEQAKLGGLVKKPAVKKEAAVAKKAPAKKAAVKKAPAKKAAKKVEDAAVAEAAVEAAPETAVEETAAAEAPEA
jgi:hypothetical protein